MNNSKAGLVFRGAFGQENFGDDMLMLACWQLGQTRFRGRTVSIDDGNASYTRQLLPDVPSTTRDNADHLVVYGGGTQFFGFPRSLGTRIRNLLIRRLNPFHKKKQRQLATPPAHTAALGIGVGPFVGNPAAIDYARQSLKRMGFVGARDSDTYQRCREWGVDSLVAGSDLCFLPGIVELVDEVRRQNTSPPDRIGIIVRDWKYQKKDFEAPLLNAVRQLRSHGAQTVFVSFCERSDQHWLRRLQELNEETIVWNPETDSVESFLQILNGFSVLITARFHGAVFGALLRKPVICVEIEPKLRLISEKLGGTVQLWSPPFDAGQCVRMVENAVELFPDHSSALESSLAAESSSAAAMVDSFCQWAERALED